MAWNEEHAVKIDCVPQKQDVQKPENTIRVQAGIVHSDHGHSSGPRDEHHGRLTTVTWNEEAVTATMTLVDLRGTAVAQRRGSLPAIADLDVPLFKGAAEIPHRQPERRQSIWGRLCRRRLEEYAPGSPLIYRHSLGARAARGAGKEEQRLGLLSSGNAVINLQYLERMSS